MERNGVLAKVPGQKFIPGQKVEKVAKGEVKNAKMYWELAGLDPILPASPTRQWNAMNHNHLSYYNGTQWDTVMCIDQSTSAWLEVTRRVKAREGYNNTRTTIHKLIHFDIVQFITLDT
jgi:hypothetical protein